MTIRPTVSGGSGGGSRGEVFECSPVGIIMVPPLKCFCFPSVSTLCVVVLLTVLFCVPPLSAAEY